MNIKTVRDFKRFSLIGFAIYMIIYYIIVLFLPEEIKLIASDIWSPLGILFSLILMGWSINNFQKGIYKSILELCFLGNLSFLFGDLTWGYYELIKGIEVPYPSIADFFYILTPLFYFAASILFFKTRGILVSVRAIFDIIVMMIIATTIEWEFIFNQLLNDTSVNTLSKFVSIFYPATDLALLFVTIFMYINYYFSGKDKFHSKLLIISPLMWIVGDQIYIVKSNLGIYVAGDIIDPLWVMGVLLISIASIYNLEFNLSQSRLKKQNTNSNVPKYVGVLSPYIGVIILLIISTIIVQKCLNNFTTE